MVLAIIVAMIALFSILSPTFRTYPTLVSVLDNTYYITLMALGVTFPLITGGVDLSIGTGLVSYALIGGFLIFQKGMPVGVAIAVCIGFGVLIGVFNGVLVAVMDLPPFLATLCTCMITRGLGPALCGGFGVSWPSALSHLAGGTTPAARMGEPALAARIALALLLREENADAGDRDASFACSVADMS